MENKTDLRSMIGSINQVGGKYWFFYRKMIKKYQNLKMLKFIFVTELLK